MAKPHFFPFFYVDFFHGTRFFDWSMQMAYLELICECWESGVISDKHFQKAKNYFSTEKFEEIKSKFTVVDGGFQHKKVEEIRKGVNKRSKVASKNGKLGGMAKASKHCSKPLAKDLANEKLPNPNPNPNPNLKPKSKSTHTERPGSRGILRPWPEGFELTEPMLEYAKKKFVKNPEDEFQAFKNWSDQLEKKFKDWEAAWRTRCDNYLVFSGDKKTTEGGYG